MGKDVTTFQDEILSFYEANKRSFPWRETQDAYKIWVSEIMLQQTQAQRVVPTYKAFIKTFPTVFALAEASFGAVLEIWTGLGYNNRAKWLRDGAQHVVDTYEGTVPKTKEALQEIKGIGPYTSRAIRIFAHNIDEVTVDTNIRRIFIHWFSLDEDVSEKELYEIAWEVLPKGRSREWHNALMDYGALKATSHATGISAKTKQSRFKGSNRWYRSKILQTLRDTSKSRTYFRNKYGDNADPAIDSLLNDGIIQEEDVLYLAN